jgi:hypothetical protein
MVPSTIADKAKVSSFLGAHFNPMPLRVQIWYLSDRGFSCETKSETPRFSSTSALPFVHIHEALSSVQLGPRAKTCLADGRLGVGARAVVRVFV